MSDFNDKTNDDSCLLDEELLSDEELLKELLALSIKDWFRIGKYFCFASMAVGASIIANKLILYFFRQKNNIKINKSNTIP